MSSSMTPKTPSTLLSATSSRETALPAVKNRI
jgi:hypothetical protein